MSVNALYKANLYILIFRFKMYYFALHLTHSELKYKQIVQYIKAR